MPDIPAVLGVARHRVARTVAHGERRGAIPRGHANRRPRKFAGRTGATERLPDSTIATVPDMLAPRLRTSDRGDGDAKAA